MEDFTAMFEACRPAFRRVAVTRLVLQMPADVGFKEWRLLLEFWRSLREIPGEENLLLILNYTGAAAPPSAVDFFESCSEFVAMAGFPAHGENVVRIEKILVSRQRASAMYLLGLADLIAFGKRHFSWDQISDAIEDLQFLGVDLHKASVIALLPAELRCDELTPEHYWAVGLFNFADLRGKPGSLPTPRKFGFVPFRSDADQLLVTALLPAHLRKQPRIPGHYVLAEKARLSDISEKARWLDHARKHNLSPLELTRSINAGRIVRLADSPSAMSSGSGIITIQSIRADFLAWARNSAELILNGEPATMEAFLEEFAPMLDFVTEVEDALAECITSGPLPARLSAPASVCPSHNQSPVPGGSLS